MVVQSSARCSSSVLLLLSLARPATKPNSSHSQERRFVTVFTPFPPSWLRNTSPSMPRGLPARLAGLVDLVSWSSQPPPLLTTRGYNGRARHFHRCKMSSNCRRLQCRGKAFAILPEEKCPQSERLGLTRGAASEYLVVLRRGSDL